MKEVNIYDDGKLARAIKATVIKDRGSRLQIQYKLPNGEVHCKWFYRRKRHGFDSYSPRCVDYWDDNLWFFRGRETKKFALEYKGYLNPTFFKEYFERLL